MNESLPIQAQQLERRSRNLQIRAQIPFETANFSYSLFSAA